MTVYMFFMSGSEVTDLHVHFVLSICLHYCIAWTASPLSGKSQTSGIYQKHACFLFNNRYVDMPEKAALHPLDRAASASWSKAMDTP